VACCLNITFQSCTQWSTGCELTGCGLGEKPGRISADQAGVDLAGQSRVCGITRLQVGGAVPRRVSSPIMRRPTVCCWLWSRSS
jgi:hypothetical protein